MDGAIEKLRLLLEEQKEIIANLRKENSRLKAEVTALSKRSKERNDRNHRKTTSNSIRKARSPPPGRALPSKPMPTRALPAKPGAKAYSMQSNYRNRDRLDSGMSTISSISSVSTNSSIYSDSDYSRASTVDHTHLNSTFLTQSEPKHFHFKSQSNNNNNNGNNTNSNKNNNNQKNNKPDGGGGVSSGMNQSDAKNSLAALLGGRSKPSSPSGGAVTTKPKKQENSSNNDSTNTSNNNPFKISEPSQLKKYYKLKKMMPVHVIVNRMRFEGVPKLLICQFEEKPMVAPPPEAVELKQISIPDPPPIPSNVKSLISARKKKKKKGKDDSKTDEEEEEEEEEDELSGLPKKKKITPNKKLKRLHWRPIATDKVIGSMWEDMNEDENVKFNINEFELHWQFRNPKPKDLGSGGGKKDGHRNSKSKDGSHQQILFVPPKRSQNVQIALSRFKMNAQEIKQAIIVMDEKTFPIEILQQFLDVVPSEDEQRETEKMANKPELNPKYFGKCEAFFYSMIDMVDLQLRLELWVFKQQYKELLTDRQVQLRTLDNACTALHKSKCLKRIFEVILAFGNYMNAGTHAGQAYGFELESLRLLAGVKTFDNSMTMMMYLYKYLFTKQPRLLDVFDELKPIKIVARMEIDLIDKSVKSIKEKVELVKSTIERWEEDYEDVLPVDDNFLHYMTEFHKDAKKQTSKLVMQHKRAQTKIHKLAAFYGHDLNESSIEALFQMIQQFLNDLEKGRDDIHKLELERDKRRKRRERKKKKARAKKKGAGGAGSPRGTGEEKKGGRKKGSKRLLAVDTGEERTILDDIKARRQTRTRVLSIIGDKLNSSLREKSKLIEAVNNQEQIPDTFTKSEVRRKVSVAYQANVQNVKVVPQGRMRLPTIVRAKGLPSLPQQKKKGFHLFNAFGAKNKNQYYHQPQKYQYGAYGYQQSSMAARERTISNNKDDMKKMNGMGQRFHDSIETPLARLSKSDMERPKSSRMSMRNLLGNNNSNSNSHKAQSLNQSQEMARMSSNPLASPVSRSNVIQSTQSLPASPRFDPSMIGQAPKYVKAKSHHHKSKKSKSKSKHKTAQTPRTQSSKHKHHNNNNNSDSTYHANMTKYQQNEYKPTPTFNSGILSPDSTDSFGYSSHNSPYSTPKANKAHKKSSFSETKVEDMSTSQFSMIQSRNRGSARDVTRQSVEQSWD